MADAIAPAPAAMLPSGPGSSGPVAVTAVSDRGAPLALPAGTTVEATVQGRASKGGVEVATASGPVYIRPLPGATLPLMPPGARVQLQMNGQGSAGQLLLTAINNRSLAGSGMIAGQAATAGTGATAPAHPATPSTAAAPPGPLPAASAATTGLIATVIRPAIAPAAGAPPSPAPQAGPAAAVPADLPVGSRLTVRIATVVPPTANAAAQPGATPPPPTASMPMAMPATGLPGAAPTTTVLTGTVIAQPPNGNAVVQTDAATLAVPTQTTLPVGARVSLEVIGSPLPPAPLASTLPRPEGLTPQGWPALTEALDTLGTSGQPQAMEQLLRVIPQPDAKLAAALVAFSGALRRGETRKLLPDDLLRGMEKAGKPGIASRLLADLESLSEDAGRPVGNGDWNAYTMPMLHGSIVEPIRLYVRRGGGEEEGGGGAGGTGNRTNDHRFVVDLHLSQLGRLQLDGLVRRDDKQFDLIIRTGAALSADMRRDILAIFTDASDIVGTKGAVSFQSGGRWMDFPPAAPPRTRLEV